MLRRTAHRIILDLADLAIAISATLEEIADHTPMSAITLHIGDVFEQLAKIPDGSIDLIVTSPPFLALRSYPARGPPGQGPGDRQRVGPRGVLGTRCWRCLPSEGRVLAPHGSLCVELGDTYSGSGGAGGDYNADGLRDGQQKFSGSAAKRAALGGGDNERPSRSGRGDGWPMSKSKTMLRHALPGVPRVRRQPPVRRGCHPPGGGASETSSRKWRGTMVKHLAHRIILDLADLADAVSATLEEIAGLLA
jgi:hypothetical protein